MDRPSPVPLKNRYLAGFLAWLVPGLGHFYQGRRGKGILYAVCILGLYLLGFAMGDGKIVFWRWLNPLRNTEDFRWAYLAQFWVGLAAFPGLVQATLAHYGYEPILGGFLAEPPGNVLNGLFPRLGKLTDVGTVYTEIAGFLNILAIYDALEGPAQVDEDEPAASPIQAQAEAAAPVASSKPKADLAAEVGS